ncbi:MAG: SHOCT domain-containing protein [Anaerolineae bacterium]
MMGTGGWLVMLLLGLALVVLVVVLVIALIAAASRGRSGTTAGPMVHESAALSAARERYARGEISREEFLRIRDDLEGRSGGPA